MMIRVMIVWKKILKKVVMMEVMVSSFPLVLRRERLKGNNRRMIVIMKLKKLQRNERPEEVQVLSKRVMSMRIVMLIWMILLVMKMMK